MPVAMLLFSVVKIECVWNVALSDHVQMVPSASTDFAACLLSVWPMTIVSLAIFVEMAHVCFKTSAWMTLIARPICVAILVCVNLTFASKTRIVLRAWYAPTGSVYPVMNV